MMIRNLIRNIQKNIQRNIQRNIVFAFVFGIVAFLLLGLDAYSEDAWWLTQEFVAKDDQLFGIPAKEVSPSFEKVSLLTEQLVSAKHPNAKSDLKKNHAKFEINQTHQGVQFKIVVGVFSNKQTSGSFLAILKNEKSRWKTVLTKNFEGNSEFSALFEVGDRVLWNNCMECGHASVLKWEKQRGYYFETPVSSED